MKCHKRHGPSHMEKAQGSLKSSFLAGQCSTEEECLLWELQSEKVSAGSKGHSKKPSTGNAREEWKREVCLEPARSQNHRLERRAWQSEGAGKAGLCPNVEAVPRPQRKRSFCASPLLHSWYLEGSGPEATGSRLKLWQWAHHSLP